MSAQQAFWLYIGWASGLATAIFMALRIEDSLAQTGSESRPGAQW